MSLLSELRRRNVLRMAVLYAVAAWLIMQVVEVLMSLVGLPLYNQAIVLDPGFNPAGAVGSDSAAMMIGL